MLRKSLDEIKDQKHWSKFIPLVMLKMNNVPAGNTAPPFLLKRNHLAKQDFNHKNISKTDEKDVYKFIAKKNELIRSTIIPKIINQRTDKRDTVKNQLQKRYSSVKLKKEDIVMLKNYFKW
jgi:hypothetical protein